MQYDFDWVTDRRNTGSMKWNVGEGELPMWVADMDFPTAPPILKAIGKRLEHGIFGYTEIPDEWYTAYAAWWKDRHGCVLEKEWLIFCTGVVPAISSVVRKLTTPNENVVIQTPVYNIFFNSIVNNGCRVLESPLRYENGSYDVNWEDLENKLRDPQTSLMILCNPHNPIGKIWDRDTLAQIGSLAQKHGVTVLSDEIHCDITRPGTGYVPFLSVSEECRNVGIMAAAPTKCFNIAGIQTAAVAVPNPLLRHKVWRALNTDEVAEPNAFAPDAAIAAFQEGGEWLDSLRNYVFVNRSIAEEYIAQSIPGLRPVHGDATYLLWIDCSGVEKDAGKLNSFLRTTTGLILSSGEAYGACGKSFLRMNLACPQAILKDGLSRLERGIKAYRIEK